MPRNQQESTCLEWSIKSLFLKGFQEIVAHLLFLLKKKTKVVCGKDSFYSKNMKLYTFFFVCVCVFLSFKQHISLVNECTMGLFFPSFFPPMQLNGSDVDSS
jgi:hypothetical protein